MKTKLLIPAILFAGLCMAGCEEAQIEGSGHGSKVTPGGGGYDPDIEDPLPKLPELEEVEDVCTKMDDLQFMEYCYTNFDVNGDSKVSMSEANAVQEIECHTASSFTGIGYFSNLRGFRSASVKSVNLGYNKGLMSLDCSGSPVKVLDLRYNTQLSDIDVSQCTGLTKLLLAADAPITAMGGGNGGSEYSNIGGCTSLEAVSLPDACTVIGDYAFKGCSSLCKIRFSESLEYIGTYAFSGCEGLVSVTFPEGLTEISASAFRGCSGLTSVAFPEGLTEICDGAFFRCTGMTSLTFPESLTTIGERAFEGCEGLTSVAFPEGLTEISEYAFSGCHGLTSVTFPESLTTIASSAFSGCTGMTSVTFLEGFITIGSRAFFNCTGLTMVDASRCQLEFLQDPYLYGQFGNCNSLRLFSIGNVVPPVGGATLIFPSLDNATLKVPAESVDVYKSRSWVLCFDNIVPLD